MENILFIAALVLFILIDLYKILRGRIDFYTFYKPLSLVIIYRYILDNIWIEALYVALAYMIICYLFILMQLNKMEEEKE
ncbi:hypothetical protein [uncultured Ezakiella sp.]|uniref:hypothetical protein n=1 Tax=uncultured Ezakiella sp. TaxID=1637529 RepID=UPI0025E7D0EC|nr:hypothetical protein [uncultured Ezakiella sp.]